MRRSVLAVLCLAGVVAGGCTRKNDPGGGLIAFSLKKGLDLEIMVIAPDGTGARVVSPSPADDETPAWAPDGLGILFVSEREPLKSGVYLFDGETRLLFGAHTWIERAPAWAPNGRTIAFMSNRDGNWEIYTVGSDGNDPRRLTETDAQERWPAWSPDSSKIVFTSDQGNQFDLYVMNADGTEVSPLTNDRGWDGRPAWSPDGKKIVWPSEREGQLAYYIMNADGSGTPVRVSSFEPRTDDRFVPGACWSPTGGRIAFVSGRDGGFKELYLVDADGSNERRLTTLQSDIVCPSWSPALPPDRSWLERE